MTIPGPASVVDGVDVDAVTAAVRGCPSVYELDGGRAATVVSTYLPGRSVPGVRVRPGEITVQVLGIWGVPVPDLAREVRTALAPLVGARRVDIVVADLRLVPGEEREDDPSEGAGAAARTGEPAAAVPSSPTAPFPTPGPLGTPGPLDPPGPAGPGPLPPHAPVPEPTVETRWTNPEPGDVPGASSSGLTTPTGAVTPPISPPV